MTAPNPADSQALLIVQARMGSTRLPGKSLQPVLGVPLLGRLLERVMRATSIAQVAVATTTLPSDDAIAEYCQQEGIAVYRGASDDVLDRYYRAALCFGGDPIVRVCGDCPLIDPHVIDEVVSYYKQSQPHCDYASNTLERSYPRGMDVEVFSFQSLEKAARLATLPAEREHVTPYIYRHPEQFRLKSHAMEGDFSHYRWTVDTDADMQLIVKLFEAAYQQNHDFTLRELLKIAADHPDWSCINAHIVQKKI